MEKKPELKSNLKPIQITLKDMIGKAWFYCPTCGCGCYPYTHDEEDRSGEDILVDENLEPGYLFQCNGCSQIFTLKWNVAEPITMQINYILLEKN